MIDFFDMPNVILFIICYIISCHGLCQIIIYSHIFEPIRECAILRKCELYTKFIQCPMCIGFWIGLLTAILILPFQYSIACGLFISATCYFLDLLHKIIEKKAE
jgi:hypothetical protein